jgi:hypothetical protein
VFDENMCDILMCLNGADYNQYGKHVEKKEEGKKQDLRVRCHWFPPKNLANFF